jgi:ComF family protein
VAYGYPWDRLVAGFKFHAALELANAFAARMLEARERAGAVLEEPAGADAAPLLLPVPLSAERLRERGYNQAWELTRRLGRALRMPTEAALLLRVRDTPHQLTLAPEKRAANVHDAFAIEPRRSEEIRGRRVTLVDDVMTSGATAAECARVLLQAGAAQVDVWVFARTPRPHDAD